MSIRERFTTAREVEKRKPDPHKRLEIPDGHLPGLYLVIQPTGAKSWAVRYRAEGRPTKLTLGRYPVITLTAARDLARDKLVAVAKGFDPAAQKRAAKAVSLPGTVNALCDQYIDRYLKRNVRQWRAVEGEINNHIRPRLGALQLDQLTRAHVRHMVDEILEDRPVAANRSLSRLRAVLNWAVAEDLIESNVTAGIKRPTKERPVDRILSDSELRAVWAASETLPFPRREFARLMVLSLQRRAEVRAMRWNEIDPAARSWIIPGERYKTGRPHLVALSDAMVEILEGMPFRDAGGYVLTVDSGRRPYSSATRLKASLDKASGVTGWTWHDLRRSGRTGLSRLGIRDDVAERLAEYAENAHLGAKLEPTLGLTTPNGEPWWRLDQRQRRGGALRELRERFYGDRRPGPAAYEIERECSRCAASSWRHDRSRADMPAHYAGTPKALIWAAFKSGASMIKKRQVQSILSAISRNDVA